MLANYTFKDGVPKKHGDPGIPTIPCSIKRNYMKTTLCDLGAGVSVMPFSLYKRLDLNKLTPTEISLQIADNSTAKPIGICEDVPVVVVLGHLKYNKVIQNSNISNNNGHILTPTEISLQMADKSTAICKDI